MKEQITLCVHLHIYIIFSQRAAQNYKQYAYIYKKAGVCRVDASFFNCLPLTNEKTISNLLLKYNQIHGIVVCQGV